MKVGLCYFGSHVVFKDATLETELNSELRDTKWSLKSLTVAMRGGNSLL